MPRPRVGMPVRLSDAHGADSRVGLAGHLFDALAELVRGAGMDAVPLTRIDLSGCDGLLLPGGGDLDPARYGGDADASLYDVNPVQDDLDVGLASAAVAAGVPVLGVCRGMQVLNIVHGGTLIEDLPATDVIHRDSTGGAFAWAWHDVALVAGSRLAEACGSGPLRVASGHHQGVARLGDGLTIAATTADGLVEAFEDADGGVLGVQWHPETDGAAAASAAVLALFAAHITARAAH